MVRRGTGSEVPLTWKPEYRTLGLEVWVNVGRPCLSCQRRQPEADGNSQTERCKRGVIQPAICRNEKRSIRLRKQHGRYAPELPRRWWIFESGRCCFKSAVHR